MKLSPSLPAARRAATVVGVAGAALALTIGSASATITVTPDPNYPDDYTITGDATPESIRPHCLNQTFYANDATPTGSFCSAVGNLRVNAGDGNDVIDLAGVSPIFFPALTLLAVDPGPGTDVVTFGGFDDLLNDLGSDGTSDTVYAGPGDDRILGAAVVYGGAGDDRLESTGNQVFGDSGNDSILYPGPYSSGGDGDDRIVDPSFGGAISGGAGEDQLVYDATYFPGTDAGITVDASTIVSSISGLGDEQSSIDGIEQLRLNGGVYASLTVDTADFPGSLQLDGTNGVDHVEAGAGDDAISTAGGDDAVVAGPGNDQVRTGAGDDGIDSRDGQADAIFCDDGTDTVVADRVDVLHDCENVSLPAPNTSAVKGPRSVVRGARAVFTFASSVPGSTFTCAIDKRAAKPCASPYSVSTGKLRASKKGVKHTLTVTAVAGTPDPTPSKVSFTVKAPRK